MKEGKGRESRKSDTKLYQHDAVQTGHRDCRGTPPFFQTVIIQTKAAAGLLYEYHSYRPDDYLGYIWEYSQPPALGTSARFSEEMCTRVMHQSRQAMN